MLARCGPQWPLEETVTRRYPLNQAQRALEDVEGLRVVKAVLVPNAD